MPVTIGPGWSIGAGWEIAGGPANLYTSLAGSRSSTEVVNFLVWCQALHWPEVHLP